MLMILLLVWVWGVVVIAATCWALLMILLLLLLTIDWGLVTTSLLLDRTLLLAERSLYPPSWFDLPLLSVDEITICICIDRFFKWFFFGVALTVLDLWRRPEFVVLKELVGFKARELGAFTKLIFPFPMFKGLTLLMLSIPSMLELSSLEWPPAACLFFLFFATLFLVVLFNSYSVRGGD